MATVSTRAHRDGPRLWISRADTAAIAAPYQLRRQAHVDLEFQFDVPRPHRLCIR